MRVLFLITSSVLFGLIGITGRFSPVTSPSSPETATTPESTSTAESVPDTAAPVPETTAPVPALVPSQLEFTSLEVTPFVSSLRKTVIIKVNVTNAGEIEVSNEATLIVNNFEEETQNITLASGETKSINFLLIKDVPGVYDIEISELADTLRVK